MHDVTIKRKYFGSSINQFFHYKLFTTRLSQGWIRFRIFLDGRVQIRFFSWRFDPGQLSLEFNFIRSNPDCFRGPDRVFFEGRIRVNSTRIRNPA